MIEKKVTAPKTYDPGKGRPKEHLAYLNKDEMAALKRMNGGNQERGPQGLPSFPPSDATSSSHNSGYGSASGSKSSSKSSGKGNTSGVGGGGGGGGGSTGSKGSSTSSVGKNSGSEAKGNKGASGSNTSSGKMGSNSSQSGGAKGSTGGGNKGAAGSNTNMGGAIGGISRSNQNQAGGSGNRGSKGGGASTQRPGAGGTFAGAGQVSAGRNNFAAAQNAYNRDQTTKNIGGGITGISGNTSKEKQGFGGGFQGPGVSALNAPLGSLSLPGNLGPRATVPGNLGPRSDSPYAQVAPTQGLGSFLGKDQSRVQTEVDPRTWSAFEADKQNRLAQAISEDMMSETIANYSPLDSIRAPTAPTTPVSQPFSGGYGNFNTTTPEGQYAVDQGLLGVQRLAEQQQRANLTAGANSIFADPTVDVAPVKQTYDRVPSYNAPTGYNPLNSPITPQDMQNRIAQGDMYGVPLPSGAINVSGVPTYDSPPPAGGIAGIQMVRPEAVGSYPVAPSVNNQTVAKTPGEQQATAFAPESFYSGYGVFNTPTIPSVSLPTQQVADPRTGYLSPNNVAQSTINPAAIGSPPPGFQASNPITPPSWSGQLSDIVESWPGQSAVPPNPATYTPGYLTPVDQAWTFNESIAPPPALPQAAASPITGQWPGQSAIPPNPAVYSPGVPQPTIGQTTPTMTDILAYYKTPQKVYNDRVMPTIGNTVLSQQEFDSMTPEGQARLNSLMQTPQYTPVNTAATVRPYDVQGYPTYQDEKVLSVQNYDPSYFGDIASYVPSAPVRQVADTTSPYTDELDLDAFDPQPPTDQYVPAITPGYEDIVPPKQNGSTMVADSGDYQITPTGSNPSSIGTPPKDPASGGGNTTPPNNNGLDWFNYYGLNPPYQTMVPTPLMQTAPISQGVGTLLPQIVVVDPFASVR